MLIKKRYSSTMTGEPFLYFEFKQVAQLKGQGLSVQEISEKVKKENLFQYRTGKSITRILAAVMKRIAVLDSILLEMCNQGSVQTSKLIVLYTIAKTNLLFEDFLREVYGEKILLGAPKLERVDFNRFFTNKAEQNDNVASWSDHTVAKLKQTFAKILVEAGLLSEKHEVTPPLIDENLSNHLKAIGEEQFIRSISRGG